MHDYCDKPSKSYIFFKKKTKMSKIDGQFISREFHVNGKSSISDIKLNARTFADYIGKTLQLN